MIEEVVGFFLDVDEGKREIMDCGTCKRPQPASCESCPLANGDQPEVPEWLAFYLQLHRRWKWYGALPDPGGLLDQSESTMRILDAIEGVIRGRERAAEKSRKIEMDRQARQAQVAAAGARRAGRRR